MTRIRALLTISIGLTVACALLAFQESPTEPKQVASSPPIIQSTPLIAATTPELNPSQPYRVTRYCGCEKCCGSWGVGRVGPVIGAYGVELIEGYSCASNLPKGTILYIEGYGEVRVDDKMSEKVVERYNGFVIDVYVKDHNNVPSGLLSLDDYVLVRVISN